MSISAFHRPRLTETSTSASDPLIVTYYFQPSVQEFQLTGVSISGNAPMTQIVFRDVAAPINIYLRPDLLAGAPGLECQPNCYDESCIEIRGGFPISNAAFFDVTNTDVPTLDELGTY